MIAFVISTGEAEVVNHLFEEGGPYMKGGLFYFAPAMLPAYLDKLTALAFETEDMDAENNALRLAERLGTWIGKAKVAPSPAPVAEPKEAGRKGKANKAMIEAFEESKVENAELYRALDDDLVIPHDGTGYADAA